MPDYTNVPVPNYLVMDVLRFITAAEEGTGPQPQGATVAHAGYDEEGRPWSADELAFIWDNRERYVSVGKFAMVMDFLASRAPRAASVDEIGEALGLDGLRLQKSLGRFTFVVQDALGDARWPLKFPGGKWALDDETAALWRTISEV